VEEEGVVVVVMVVNVCALKIEEVGEGTCSYPLEESWALGVSGKLWPTTASARSGILNE
jgi:hypothetical protein